MKSAPRAARTLADVWKAFKQLNPENVRRESERLVRVGVVGPVDLLYDTVEFMLGSDMNAYEQAEHVLILLPTPLDPGAYALLPRCDVILCSSQHTDTFPGVPTERIFKFSSVEDLPAVIIRVLDEPSINYITHDRHSIEDHDIQSRSLLRRKTGAA